MLWSEPQGGKRFTRSQDEEIVDDIKKTPHPEEAAKQLSRRMHCANPADLQFFHSLESGRPGQSLQTLPFLDSRFAGMTTRGREPIESAGCNSDNALVEVPLAYGLEFPASAC